MPSAVPASADAVLCIDIGDAVQAALLYTRGETPARFPRMVFPSPARMLARRIAALTEAGRGVYVHGPLMGGGFLPALFRHVEAGWPASIHPACADAFARNGVLFPQGLALSGNCPEGYTALQTGDVDLASWQTLCRLTGLEWPPRILAAVSATDGPSGEVCGTGGGGGKPGYGAMAAWREMSAGSGDDGIVAARLAYGTTPPSFSRLAAVHAVTGGPVTDSGTAAMLGLLSVASIAKRSHRQGLLLVNAGNTRISAFLVYRERVFGVYEQYASGIGTERLEKDFTEFRLGWLPNESVVARGGIGCFFTDLPPEAEGFKPAYITGPGRENLSGMGQMAAASDDAAFTGCFGLLHGAGYV